jgi:hypothetical protein
VPGSIITLSVLATIPLSLASISALFIWALARATASPFFLQMKRREQLKMPSLSLYLMGESCQYRSGHRISDIWILIRTNRQITRGQAAIEVYAMSF